MKDELINQSFRGNKWAQQINLLPTELFFIAQLVEHWISIAEVTGSNPIEATWIC